MKNQYLSEITQAKKHLKKYIPLVKELVKRDLKVKYRRSALGYLWSLLNPLMMMTIMSIVFSFMFRNNIENFPMYLICGNTLYCFFNEATTVCMDSIVTNGALIRKVYIPKFIFPLSRVVSSFVTMLFSLAAILIVMVLTRADLHWTLILFWFPLLMLFLFCFGIGMLLSALTVKFRDVLHLYSVVTLAWMYITPIFYPIDMLPKQIIPIIMLNPLYHYITFFRQVIIYGTVPVLSTWLACFGFSVLSILVGVLVFRKMQRTFILYI